MLKFQITLFFIFSFIQSISAQDSLSKTEILEQMKVFRNCKKDMSKYLQSDSVYFVSFCRRSPEYNYVDFYNLFDTKEKRRNGIIYQFYFLKDNLIFIVQGSRNRKHFSNYYLNQGIVFSSELNTLLPVLSQQTISELKMAALEIRNKVRKADN